MYALILGVFVQRKNDSIRYDHQDYKSPENQALLNIISIFVDFI